MYCQPNLVVTPFIDAVLTDLQLGYRGILREHVQRFPHLLRVVQSAPFVKYATCFHKLIMSIFYIRL